MDTNAGFLKQIQELDQAYAGLVHRREEDLATVKHFLHLHHCFLEEKIYLGTFDMSKDWSSEGDVGKIVEGVRSEAIRQPADKVVPKAQVSIEPDMAPTIKRDIFYPQLGVLVDSLVLNHRDSGSRQSGDCECVSSEKTTREFFYIPKKDIYIAVQMQNSFFSGAGWCGITTSSKKCQEAAEVLPAEVAKEADLFKLLKNMQRYLGMPQQKRESTAFSNFCKNPSLYAKG